MKKIGTSWFVLGFLIYASIIGKLADLSLSAMLPDLPDSKNPDSVSGLIVGLMLAVGVSFIVGYIATKRYELPRTPLQLGIVIGVTNFVLSMLLLLGYGFLLSQGKDIASLLTIETLGVGALHSLVFGTITFLSLAFFSKKKTIPTIV